MARYTFTLVNGHEGTIDVSMPDGLDGLSWIDSEDGRWIQVSAIAELTPVPPEEALEDVVESALAEAGEKEPAATASGKARPASKKRQSK